jgi:uncharacterized protein YndB with AHSA1/START domain
MNELELTVSRTIAAPRKEVFDAWLSPAMLAKFMGPPSAATGNADVSNDPVKGGRFSIVMKMDGRDVPHSGTYLEIDPHTRLAFTWQSPHSLDDSEVTIDFAEPVPGKTAITLKQVKFKSEGARDGHITGWNTIIDNLAKQIDG